MEINIASFLPHLLILSSVFSVFFISPLWLFLERRKARRKPFTKDFLRSSGESLQFELDEVRSDIMENYFLILFLPVLLMAAYFGAQLYGETHSSPILSVILSVSVVSYYLFRLTRNLKKGRKLQLGVES